MTRIKLIFIIIIITDHHIHRSVLKEGAFFAALRT